MVSGLTAAIAETPQTAYPTPSRRPKSADKPHLVQSFPIPQTVADTSTSNANTSQRPTSARISVRLRRKPSSTMASLKSGFDAKFSPTWVETAPLRRFPNKTPEKSAVALTEKPVTELTQRASAVPPAQTSSPGNSRSKPLKAELTIRVTGCMQSQRSLSISTSHQDANNET